MKRMLMLAALLCAATACAPAEPGAGNANLAANTATRATPQATPPAVSEADLVALDRQIWEAIKAKNWDAFASHLADDAVTVARDGVYDKAQTVEGLKKFNLTDYSISETKVVRLDQDVALLTYTSRAGGTYDGQPVPDAPSRDTTIFVNRGGKWLAVFHQESAVATPTPTPAGGAATPAASPAAVASPASSPAAPPANVTEAEQQVWDALKRKDWAAFAAFLADDQIEVEPGGVYTRAQTLENVRQIDFSRVTLSDFREVKIDADASVLTYTVRSTGQGWSPNGQRHSTAWVRRNGRWQAIFHQGTVIEK